MDFSTTNNITGKFTEGVSNLRYNQDGTIGPFDESFIANVANAQEFTTLPQMQKGSALLQGILDGIKGIEITRQEKI